jgi:hypothetical protein
MYNLFFGLLIICYSITSSYLVSILLAQVMLHSTNVSCGHLLGNLSGVRDYDKECLNLLRYRCGGTGMLGRISKE